MNAADLEDAKKELLICVKNNNLNRAIEIYRYCITELYIGRQYFNNIDSFVRGLDKEFYYKIGHKLKGVLLIRCSNGFALYLAYILLSFKRRIKYKNRYWFVESDRKNQSSIRKRKILKLLGVTFLDKKMQKLRKLKNIHKGKRCFIVCTGPSLKISDLEKLNGEITFGINSIYDSYPLTNWRPTYYVAVEKLVVQELFDNDICFGRNFSKGGNFFTEGFNLPHPTEYDYYLLCSDKNMKPINKARKIVRLSKDISVCVYGSATTANIAVQIAIYMGFKEIYLIGADCDYSKNKIHFIKRKNDDDLIKVGFIKNSGLDLIDCYKTVKSFAKKNGVKIYNATRGGKLEVFERVDFDKIV